MAKEVITLGTTLDGLIKVTTLKETAVVCGSDSKGLKCNKISGDRRTDLRGTG